MFFDKAVCRFKDNIIVVRASVVDMKVDAIVNAANTTLLGGGGVDGAIHKKAGPKLLEECKALNGCKVGEAKITKSYNIKNTKHIIHTVGPVYSGSEKDKYLLSECYKNSLNLAYKYNLKSIAFPGISTGVYGYPIDKAAEVSLKSVIKWFDNHNYADINVYFCCFRDIEFESYKKIIEKESYFTS